MLPSVKYHSFSSIPFCGMHQMAAFNIQEALIWKEKIEMVIDQVQHVETLNCANLLLILQSTFFLRDILQSTSRT